MSDKAERLHDIMNAILTSAQNMKVDGLDYNSAPLWRFINPIATNIGYVNYSDLNEQFIYICSSLKDEVSLMSLKKESVRDSWITCINRVQNVFDATNFQLHASKVLKGHFSTTNMSVVEAISERLQTDGVYESTDEELKSALDAVENLVIEMEASKNLNPKFVRIFKHYLYQLKSIYNTYDLLGDSKFWKIYKESFATFFQIHSQIVECDNSKNIFNKFKSVIVSLASKKVAGISLVANAATVAQFYLDNK